MGLLRRFLARFRRDEETTLSALALQVYKRPEGVAIVVSCEQGDVLMMLDRARVVALCDLLMDSIEEAEPPASGLQ